jgi:hypothetical protein
VGLLLFALALVKLAPLGVGNAFSDSFQNPAGHFHKDSIPLFLPPVNRRPAPINSNGILPEYTSGLD